MKGGIGCFIFSNRPQALGGTVRRIVDMTLVVAKTGFQQRQLGWADD